MSKNPFEEFIPFVLLNEEKRNKLLEASAMWDALTDDGNNPDDMSLYTVLTACGLENLMPKYEFYRNSDAFDLEAINSSLEEWALSF